MEDEYFRGRVRRRLEGIGEKNLAWLNKMNTAGIHTGCFCQECGSEITLIFYEEDEEVGISIACQIDGTPTVRVEDIQKFTNILRGAKVALELKRAIKKEEGRI